MGIKYTGLKDLTEKETEILKAIVEKEYPKIKRLIKNKAELFVKIKVLKKVARKRFNINIRLNTATRTLGVENKDTEKGGDWDLTKAMHKELNALYFEIKHKFKTDVENWKKGGIKRLFNRLNFRE